MGAAITVSHHSLINNGDVLLHNWKGVLGLFRSDLWEALKQHRVIRVKRIPGCRFVVLNQQRYAPAVPWEVWFLVTLILIAIFLTLAIRYVYRISRPSESYE